jgi:hypothetical protein
MNRANEARGMETRGLGVAGIPVRDADNASEFAEPQTVNSVCGLDRCDALFASFVRLIAERLVKR